MAMKSAVIFFAAASLCLTACGDKSAPQTQNPAAAQEAASSGPKCAAMSVQDMSWNDTVCALAHEWQGIVSSLETVVDANTASAAAKAIRARRARILALNARKDSADQDKSAGAIMGGAAHTRKMAEAAKGLSNQFRRISTETPQLSLMVMRELDGLDF